MVPWGSDGTRFPWAGLLRRFRVSVPLSATHPSTPASARPSLLDIRTAVFVLVSALWRTVQGETGGYLGVVVGFRVVIGGSRIQSDLVSPGTLASKAMCITLPFPSTLSQRTASPHLPLVVIEESQKSKSRPLATFGIVREIHAPASFGSGCLTASFVGQTEQAQRPSGYSSWPLSPCSKCLYALEDTFAGGFADQSPLTVA